MEFKTTNLDNVNEGLSVPSADDFLAATNLGSGIPIVEKVDVNGLCVHIVCGTFLIYHPIGLGSTGRR